MLILATAVFLHVPKTGGTWVKEALTRAGGRFTEYLVDGDCHGDLSYCPCPERFKIAFVRHPCTLYRSYWRYKVASGWDSMNPFDVECRADCFNAFTRNVLDRYPGWCSRMFEDYVGSPDRPIEFIGRFERLADDLVAALRQAGIRFDEAKLRSTPPLNVTERPGSDMWSRDLQEMVAISEREALVRFGYAGPPWAA
jgi:hypothetical protein